MPTDRHLDDETLALLALGALEPADAEPVELHLQTCDACRERFAERLGEVALLAESTDPAEPSPEIRGRVLERVASEPRRRGGPSGAPARRAAADPAAVSATPPPRRRRHLPWLALAASLLVGALLGFWAARAFVADDVDRASVQAERLQEDLATARREIDRLERNLGTARTLLALAAARESVSLAGLESAADAHGRVFIDRQRGRALFVAGDLPPLPDERIYQLWRIVDGQPVSAGLLDPREAEGVLVERVDHTVDETWAVTVEPAGGVPAPTGRMVLSS